METEKILELISRGRTDFVFELMKQPNWKEILLQGAVNPLQWLVYYNDTTGLRAVLENGGNQQFESGLTRVGYHHRDSGCIGIRQNASGTNGVSGVAG